MLEGRVSGNLRLTVRRAIASSDRCRFLQRRCARRLTRSSSPFVRFVIVVEVSASPHNLASRAVAVQRAISYAIRQAFVIQFRSTTRSRHPRTSCGRHAHAIRRRADREPRWKEQTRRVTNGIARRPVSESVVPPIGQATSPRTRSAGTAVCPQAGATYSVMRAPLSAPGVKGAGAPAVTRVNVLGSSGRSYRHRYGPRPRARSPASYRRPVDVTMFPWKPARGLTARTVLRVVPSPTSTVARES